MKAREFVFVGLSLLSSLMLSASLPASALTNAFSITSSFGSIDYGGTDPSLIFHTALESVVIPDVWDRDNWVSDGQVNLDWGFPGVHYVWFDTDAGGGDLDNNGWAGIVTGGQDGNPPAFSGTKIGKCTWQPGQWRRVQFNWNLDSQELGFACWFFLPTDYSNDGWHEIGDPNKRSFYVDLLIKSDLSLRISNHSPNTGGTGETFDVSSSSLDRVPLGRWFKLSFYCYRHPTEGIIKVWLDDKFVLGISPQGIDAGTGSFTLAKTDTTTTGNAPICGPKIYTDRNDTPKVFWFDDLSIYDGMPT